MTRRRSAPASPVVLVAEAVTRDERLTAVDRAAWRVLWAHLSPAEYRPMKPLALAILLGVSERTARRRLKRLEDLRYIISYRFPDDGVMRYLAVNAVPKRVLPAEESRVAPLETSQSGGP